MAAGRRAQQAARGRRKKLKARLTWERQGGREQLIEVGGVPPELVDRLAPAMGADLEDALTVLSLCNGEIHMDRLPTICDAYSIDLDDELIYRMRMIRREVNS